MNQMVYVVNRNTPVEESCINKKRLALVGIETKLSIGLDRLLNNIVGYVRFVLTSEQKKNDFRPENDDQIVPLCSNVSYYSYDKYATFRHAQ
jgi:hypothetical protein